MKPMHHHIRILNRLRWGFGTAVLLGIIIPQLAVANPLGPQVVSGQATFTTQGKTLSVTNSDRAIINWQDFSIANGELTRFIQPAATSAVLNRVIGNNPSAIYGALQSNGRVYLVNQNGIFMGPTATIDVNGLVASTLNITDGDFKAGRINFNSGPLAGKIENQGAIRTPAGGSIYLIAPDVTNSGIINAPNGDILLAAGQQVSLVESTTPEIAVVVSAPGEPGPESRPDHRGGGQDRDLRRSHPAPGDRQRRQRGRGQDRRRVFPSNERHHPRQRQPHHRQWTQRRQRHHPV